jgi:hypothetical protein
MNSIEDQINELIESFNTDFFHYDDEISIQIQ